MKLIIDQHFKTWKSLLDVDIENEFSAIQKQKLEPHSFTFYTSVSVMSSSKIEGEKMEVDSYVKHKMLNIEYLQELTEKPNDLYTAYLFANSRANRMKVLVHDGIGVWLAARRLNQGKFVWPKTADTTLALSRLQFGALILGLPWQRLGEAGIIGVL